METNMDALLNQARLSLQSGHFGDAESVCRTALAQAPEHPHALHLMGLVLALRHEPQQALPLLQKAAQLQPDAPEIHFDLAHAFSDTGKLEDAAAGYRRTLKLAPTWPAPWINLANILIKLNQPDEAIDLTQRGRKLFPDNADLANALGNAMSRKGYFREALAAYGQAALLAPESPDILHNQAYALQALGDIAGAQKLTMDGLRSSPHHDGLKILAGNLLQVYRPDTYEPELSRRLSTALREGWGDSASLSTSAWHLLQLDPALEGWRNANFEKTTEKPLLPLLEKAARHPLLLDLLRHGLVNHPHWEIWLTGLRKILLDLASDATPISAELLEFTAALAEQCFHNEYVFNQTEDEEITLDRLEQRISVGALTDQALTAALAIYSAYRPLNRIPVASLPLHEPPSVLKPLFQQHITEAQEETRIAAALPSLSPIAHGLSAQVRRQYEENPYPRWKTAPLLDAFGTPEETLAALFPGQGPFPLPVAPKVLVAGTGTGLHAILTARRFPRADILAIDLSRTSLAYAARKAKELGHANIRFAQADILNLSGWAERFHIIESVGVLHHMEDTLGAWRILSELLAPDGLMKIGLYSRIGRAGLLPVREEIRRHGLEGSAKEIRAFRARTMAPDAPPHLAAATKRHDFFTLSTCRDLLFHVHQHEFDLGEISAMLVELKLEFLGFELNDATALRAYQAQNPRERDMNDLGLWQRWEQAHPDQFSGMYQFWVRKSR